MNLISVLYVFSPFLAEVILRWFQHTITLNYCAISFFIALVNFIPFISFPRLKKFWIWYYFVLFYIPTFVDLCHIFFFIGSIDSPAMKAVFESNSSEIKEFFVNFSNPCSLTFVISLITCSVILLKKVLATPLRIRRRKILFPLFCVGIIASCFVHDKYKPTFARIVKSYGYYMDEKNFLIKCMETRKNFDYGEIKSLIPETEKQTYVIVIGESANREHLSLYGYKRKTTPQMDALKNELYVFDNVTSAHCQTLEVLQEALTFDTFSAGDVISFFQKAGFKTFWLSNQFNGGRWDNTIAMVGNMADVSLFINQKDTQATNGLCFDELLLPHFTKALEDPSPKKVIFIHLLGSHAVYSNRYPKSFEIFKDDSDKTKQIICEYDNSITYTDFILSRLIRTLKQKKEISYLVYFSDHGEDVTDSPNCSFYHSPSLALPSMFSIPFFVWISDNYLNQNSDFVKNWNLHKKYTTNKLIHSILRLSRLQNHKIKKEFSVFE